MAGLLSSFMGLFGSAKGVKAQEDPGDVYSGLRRQILEANPSKLKLKGPENKVWAVLMETSFPDYSYTLMASADGSVSLYLSTGGGMIGLGGVDEINRSASAFIDGASNYLSHMKLAKDFPLPKPGHTTFYLRSFGGTFTATAKEEDLGNNKHPLSPLFHLGQDVITQARLHDEKRLALIGAAARGDLALAKRLVSENIGVDTTDNTGLSPLMAAVHEGQIELAKYLIDQKANLELKDEKGYTALMFAANSGKIDCVRALVEADAQVSARDNDDSTPLMFAAQHGYNDVAQYLMSKGADPQFKGKHGLSALGFAQQNGLKETEAILLGK
jgi:Ankyrin repeats (3 copies)/Ankyrin repeat